jgi:hypothetical protein
VARRGGGGYRETLGAGEGNSAGIRLQPRPDAVMELSLGGGELPRGSALLICVRPFIHVLTSRQTEESSDWPHAATAGLMLAGSGAAAHNARSVAERDPSASVAEDESQMRSNAARGR